MARPSKLSMETINSLCEWVSQDVPLRFCAEGCGITYMTLNNWLNKGLADFENEVESLEAELFYRLKKEYAMVVRKSVAKIKAGGTNWQGECWIRQRRDNEFMDKQEFVAGDEKVVIQFGNTKGKHTKDDKTV